MDYIIQSILATLVAFGWLYWLCALIAVRSFFKEEEVPAQENPPVSILKPVKGIDYQAHENFVSFCHQDYPEYEILFGVLEPSDPVVPIIRRLQREFPHRSIQLVLGTPLGYNPKVSNLYHLERKARYETLVITDSDMRARPDFLRRIVAPLAKPRVSLVTALSRGIEARTRWARLEALYLGASLTPSAILGRRLEGMRFAVGTCHGPAEA